MEIEQLKLILETLQGVGHEAGNLAALYLWLQFAGSVFTNLSFVGVFVGIGYAIYKLNIGTGGYLTDHEHQRTIAKLHQLVAEAKLKEKQ
jgi:hypothetical protein